MSPERALVVGLIGCGHVSRKYLATLAQDDRLVVAACADVDVAKAEELATEFAIPRWMSVDELLADPSIDLVLNLTVPAAHASVTLAALQSGKHVYSEKPLASSLDDAEHILATASDLGLRVGCAPDTFLGPGMQATRDLIVSGAIGRPLLAQCTLLTLGPELFHPGPEFLYLPGMGPLFDVGPYLVTSLMFLMGRVEAVTAVTATPQPARTFAVGERAGTDFESQAPTFVSATLQFAGGAFGTIAQSWDVVGTTAPPMEIHGMAGSIVAPRADDWLGAPLIKRTGEETFAPAGDWTGRPIGPSGLGLGLLEMATALRENREPEASAERGFRTLQVLLAIAESGATGRRIRIE